MDIWDMTEDNLDNNNLLLMHDSFEHERGIISKKKTNSNAFTVEREFVNSKSFHDHFVVLPINKNVQDTLYEEAGIILEMLDGKNEERLVAINARNGTKVVDNYNRKGLSYKTGFTDDEYKKILECEDYIVLLHNHPDGSMPSGTDLITFLEEDKVKMSVVVGHDGDLYAIIDVKQEVKKIYSELFDGYVMQIGADNEDIAKTLATDALYKLNKNNSLFEVRRYHNE